MIAPPANATGRNLLRIALALHYACDLAAYCDKLGTADEGVAEIKARSSAEALYDALCGADPLLEELQ